MTKFSDPRSLDANFANLFDLQSKATPDAVAIIDEGTWTYQDLQERMHEYSAGLASYDLKPESTIAVFLPRDGDMVAMLLAIRWSGYAYVPIDPEDPPERACRIVQSAECKLVVGEAKLLANLKAPNESAKLPPLVQCSALISAEKGKPPIPVLQAVIILLIFCLRLVARANQREWKSSIAKFNIYFWPHKSCWNLLTATDIWHLQRLLLIFRLSNFFSHWSLEEAFYCAAVLR